jgi:hypothetical protein
MYWSLAVAVVGMPYLHLEAQMARAAGLVASRQDIFSLVLRFIILLLAQVARLAHPVPTTLQTMVAIPALTYSLRQQVAAAVAQATMLALA